MDQNSRSRKCFVPDCDSSMRRTPEKSFFYVPKDLVRRKLWFQSADRQDEPKEKSTYVCCQDHFNFPDDLDATLSLKKGAKVLKKTAVPCLSSTKPCNKNNDMLHDGDELAIQSSQVFGPKNTYQCNEGLLPSECSPRRSALNNITNSPRVVLKPSRVGCIENGINSQSNDVEDGRSLNDGTKYSSSNSLTRSCAIDLNKTYFKAPHYDHDLLPVGAVSIEAPMHVSLCRKDGSSRLLPEVTSSYTLQNCDAISFELKNNNTVEANNNEIYEQLQDYENFGGFCSDNGNDNDCREGPECSLESCENFVEGCCTSVIETSDNGFIDTQCAGISRLNQTDPYNQIPLQNQGNGYIGESDEFIIVKDIGVQVGKRLTKPHRRAKGVQCKLAASNETKASQTNVADCVDRACSPTFPAPKRIRKESVSDLSSMGTGLTNSTLEYEPSQSECGFSSSTEEEERKRIREDMKLASLEMTRYHISLNPKQYLGIDAEWIWIIDMLSSETKCSADNIKLTLMKIRLNDTFSRLGDMFGVSESQASRIFGRTIIPLAHFLQTLVFFPDPSDVKKNLPIAFRARYSHVFGIIDAFEIEMEKPSNPVYQSLSWSEYKKGNTAKYIILCTADGLICLVSKGYGGRITDCSLVVQSKLLEKLPQNCAIMADRGFKNLQTLLEEKNCVLLRPPSVSKSAKPSKEEVLETKVIASLRIHVERVIRRVREFKLLAPHACVDSNLLNYLDSAVTVAAGLINLQKPIIRK